MSGGRLRELIKYPKPTDNILDDIDAPTSVEEKSVEPYRRLSE